MSGVSGSIENIRSQFPILREKIHGHPLAYLDNGASTQKPIQVIEAVDAYYKTINANVHRGIHLLSQKATDAFESSRNVVADFVNATDTEIVFTRGTTEAINLVAQSWGGEHLGPGKTVVISYMEHHSNIVPWQQICEQTGAELRVMPITEEGDLVPDWVSYIDDSVAIVSVVHASNALGTVNPVKEIAEAAHAHGALVLVDGAQSLAHIQVDVRALDCDFYAGSAHKVYGPTGIGFLYARRQVLEAMRPWHGGGDMIRSVSFERTTYNDIPYRFEAGTPHIAGAIGFAEALRFVQNIGFEEIARHEKQLLEAILAGLGSFEQVRIVGTPNIRSGVVSFVTEGIHAHDIGTLLDENGVAIRVGHHCAQPVMDFYNVQATARASVGIYNTMQDVEQFLDGLRKAIRLFSRFSK